MPTAQLQFKSTNDSATIEEVIQRLRKLDGVVNIGKEDTVEGVSGIIIFENAELAAAARNRTDYVDIVTLIDPALDKPAKSSAAARKKKESARKGTTTISTAELFVAPPPSAQQPRRPESQGKRQQRPASGEGRGRGRGEGRGRRGGAAPTAEQNGDEQRVNRRRGPSNRQRPRTITAYVACVHNVPYSATNDMVFHAFKHTGHILDIARAERLALLYMREPEQVTEAIVQMNGKPFMNSVLAVCSGGEMKLPVPPPPQQPQEQLPPANPHVIEAVPPTVTA